MADISSIKTPDNAIYDLKAKKIFYAECATASDVVAKVITCDGFILEAGAVIAVRFTNTGTTLPTSGNLTLNVNNTGAKNIVPKGNNIIFNYGGGWLFRNNTTWLFVYNGTYFVMLNQDNNTTYTPMSLGFGYGTCTTAEATAAKVAALASYAIVKNGIVSVKFTYAVPANATLNINNRGAKNIFYRGAKITAGIISAGDIATFVYDGAQYQLIAVDSRNALTVGGHTVLSNVPANAKFTDTVYTLPTAGSTLGGVKTTSTVSSTSGLTACPIIGGVPYYKDTNTTYDLSGYAKKTDIPTSLLANGGNADTVDGKHASAFLGGGFVYVSYIESDPNNSTNLNDYVTDYHGFVYNCTNSPTDKEYGFLDVSNFYGGGFTPSPPADGGVIRQIFTSYNTGKTYLRLRIKNVWGSWKCFADGGDSATVNGRAAWRISTIDQNGNQWDASAPNINDMYAQWDDSKKYFKLKTLGGNNVAVDVATSSYVTGSLSIPSGAITVNVGFKPSMAIVGSTVNFYQITVLAQTYTSTGFTFNNSNNILTVGSGVYIAFR